MFYRDERVALFIDGANLYAATKALGFDCPSSEFSGQKAA